jgi:HPt (histidine-containing phosphotransfer) domain-containing protein
MFGGDRIQGSRNSLGADFDRFHHNQIPRQIAIRHFVTCCLGVILLIQAGLARTADAAPNQLVPIATQGQIDLTAVDLQQALPLKGEWRFFWKQLVVPEQVLVELEKPADYIKIPNVWNDHIDPISHQAIGGIGYGSYLLRVDGLNRVEELGLNLFHATSCYKLWVLDANDPTRILLTLENGVVGVSKETSISQNDFRLGRFEKVQDLHSVFVLIQVANFSWIHGGLFHEPVLAHFNTLQSELEESKVIGHIVFGIVSIIALYNMSLFIYRREDYGSLFLAILCICISITYARVIPNFLYLSAAVTERNHWIFRSVYFVTNLILTASFNSFIRACFPKQSFKSLDYLCWIWAVVIAVPLIFFQSSMPELLFRFYQYFHFFCDFLALTQIIRALKNKEVGALISFIGTGILVASFINDALINFKIIQGVRVLPFGISLFVLLQSQIVAIRFAEAFRQSEKLGRDLQQEVERQTRDIKTILKNIKQGIFTLVPPFKKAGDQYSDYLVKILGTKEIVGQTIDQLLLKQSDLSSDAKSQIESALDASFGETILAFEMNESCLATELSFQNNSEPEKHIFEIDWNPIVNKQDEVEKILVSLRDVTEVRRIHAIAEQREEDIRIMIEILQISEDKFGRFITKTSEYINENRAIITNLIEPRSEVLRRLFMNMHTIKGAARAYALKSISTSAHDIEQYYAALLRHEAEWDQDKLIADLDEVHRIISYYQKIGEDRLGWNCHEKMVKISRNFIEQNLLSLQEIESRDLSYQQKNQIEIVSNRLSELCYDPLSMLIEEATRGLDSIARDLKKEMPVIVVTENNIRMKEKGAKFIYSVFLHLIRNSMDHGIEGDELRIARGKSRSGTISIAVEVLAESLVLNYHDDGNGLNLEAIQNKGVECGLLQANQVYSDVEIASLIYVSGFSTKNAVSEISGRGVGLDAVNTYCKDIGASIAIKIDDCTDRHRVAFSFELIIPSKCYWTPLHADKNLQKAS